MEYDDFFIRIGPNDGQGHRLDVRSPSGDGSAILRLPFGEDEVIRLTASAQAWQPARRPPPSTPQDSKAALRQLGNDLFQALFPDSIRDLFYESRGRAEQSGRGLRVRLAVDPQYPNLLRLLVLPWELLRPDDEDFLALSRGTPIVRHPAVPRPAGDRPAIRDLRVLAVLAQPKDQRDLGLDNEWRILDDVWRNHPTVSLVTCRNPTLDTLRAALEDNEPHVLHFMGHGGFDSDQKEWILCLVHEDGRADAIPASTFAEELADFRHVLQLVVLNACHGARVVEEATAEASPGAGVALAMIAAGLPAVVAMQSIITDRAAVEFTKGLYPRLAEGDPLERAVAVARKRLHGHERSGAVWPAEWATPVIFLRSENGELFDAVREDAQESEPESSIIHLENGEAVEPKSRFSTTLGHPLLKGLLVIFFVAMIIEIILATAMPKYSYTKELYNHYQQRLLLESIDSQMIKVVEGVFVMGLTRQHIEELLGLDPSWKEEYFQDETPARGIYLNEYEIGKYEIANWQYGIFRRLRYGDKHAGALGGADAPAVNVSWDDATQFCGWLSEISGQYYHLPTEAQWEKAARSVDGRYYPWGNAEPGRRRANYGSSDLHLISVGSLPDGANEVTGTMEMAGNAGEWCQDWYSADHYSNSPDDPLGPNDGSEKVVRGGSWDAKKFFIRCTARSFSPPAYRSARIGFRIVREPVLSTERRNS